MDSAAESSVWQAKFSRAWFWVKARLGSIIYLVVSLVGTLAPLWLTALVFLGFHKLQDPSVFWQNGEFYLYSAALSTQTFYVAASSVMEGRGHLVKSIFYMGVSGLLVAISAALYTSFFSSHLIADPNWTFAPSYVLLTSTILFVLSLLFFYQSDRDSRQDQSVKERYEEGKIAIEEQLG